MHERETIRQLHKEIGGEDVQKEQENVQKDSRPQIDNLLNNAYHQVFKSNAPSTVHVGN